MIIRAVLLLLLLSQGITALLPPILAFWVGITRVQDYWHNAG
jgi:hypothetical protein